MYQIKPSLQIDFMNELTRELVDFTNWIAGRILASSISPFGTIVVATYFMKPSRISSSLSVLASFSLLMPAASIIQNLFSKSYYTASH